MFAHMLGQPDPLVNFLLNSLGDYSLGFASNSMSVVDNCSFTPVWKGEWQDL